MATEQSESSDADLLNCNLVALNSVELRPGRLEKGWVAEAILPGTSLWKTVLRLVRAMKITSQSSLS